MFGQTDGMEITSISVTNTHNAEAVSDLQILRHGQDAENANRRDWSGRMPVVW